MTAKDAWTKEPAPKAIKTSYPYIADVDVLTSILAVMDR